MEKGELPKAFYVASYSFYGEHKTPYQKLTEEADRVAKGFAGHLGSEKLATQDGRTGRRHYWESAFAIEAFHHHGVHNPAKDGRGEWRDDYKVEIARLAASEEDRGVYRMTSVNSALEATR